MLQPNDNLDEKLKEFFELQPEVEPLPRMLFLDDRTKRIEAARKKYEGVYDVTFVHNAKECLRYLCREEFDIVSLDHDLDGNDFQDPDDVTSGMEVVRYIEKCGADTVDATEFWVHSSNLFAANLMIRRLTDIGLKAYYKRFQYGDEIKFGDATPSHKPKPIKGDWHVVGLRKPCVSCGLILWVDKNCQCDACYERELVSSSGLTIEDYWRQKKEQS